MANQKSTNWKKYELVSAVIAAVSLVVCLLTFIPHDPDWFWSDHIRGLRGAAGMLFLVGLIWTALSAAMGRTSFFDATRPLGADRFIITLIAIGCGTAIAIGVTLPFLPKTPADKLPPDPKAKAKILMEERHLRSYAAAGLLFAGAIVAVIPCRRFLQKGAAVQGK